MNRVTYSYKISELKKLLIQRTSYLGKMRSTEENAHLFERLSLTDGEDFLRDDFINEAASEVYSYLAAFGRGGDDRFLINNGNRYVISERCGCGFGNDRLHICSRICDAEDWSSDENGNLYFDFLEPMQLYMGNADVVYMRMYFNYTTGVGIVRNKRGCVQYGEYSNSRDSWTIDRIGVPEDKFILENIDGLGRESLIDCEAVYQISEIEPQNSYDVSRGDYIVREMLDGSKQYYSILSPHQDVSGLTDDFVKFARQDSRDLDDSLIYELDLLDWQDRSVMASIDNGIRESLIDWVMYRWLEYTLPDESNIYHERFLSKMDDVHKLLNRERVILHRGSNWF